MKSSLALLAVFSCGVSAFAPQSFSSQPTTTTQRSVLAEPVTETVKETTVVNGASATLETPAAKEETSETAAKETSPAIVDSRDQLQPGRFDSLSYSKALPFFDRPANLDGSHAGDIGFDPCGLSDTFDLYYMQECELRHGRLAMLAVVGWPMSEFFGPAFMLQDGRAPSVLNGFNPISAAAVLTFFAAFGVFEYQTSLRRTAGTKLGDKHKRDMSLIWDYGVAGDYNFDPLDLYDSLGDDAEGRRAIRGVEVAQGRYAMLGITYFAIMEALTGKPIIEDNMFFHPNPLLPLLAVSYFAWSQFYQVSDVREYPIRIEYTKDGEEMLRGLKRTMDGLTQE